jgi:hypothetical protein
LPYKRLTWLDPGTVLPAQGRGTADVARFTDWWMPGFALLLVLGTLGRAVTKPLWHDEIFTLYLATRTTVGGLWDALRTGADLNPPLYHLLVKAAAALVGPGALAARLPAVLGFTVATLAIYVFLRRRLAVPSAMAGALIPSVSAVLPYAYEGRPYGVVLGFSALALVAWQRRGDEPAPRLAPLACGVALVAATSTHYYAVLMLLPLAAGELARMFVRRRLDVPMLTALAAGLTPFLFLWPLIAGARQFTSGFWSRPDPGQLTDLYHHLLDPLALPLLVAAVGLSLAWAWDWLRSSSHVAVQRSAAENGGALRLEELSAALMLLALPVVGYGLGVLITGAFHERYVLQGVLGLAIMGGWWASRLAGSRRSAAVLVGALLLASVFRLGGGVFNLFRGQPDALHADRPLLSRAPDDGPLVIAHALTYLPLAHYSDPGAAARLVYLTRPADVVEKLGVDTGGRALRQLGAVAPLHIEDYESFVSTHPHFYVYGPKSWLIPKLLSQNAVVRLMGQSETASLYAVDIPRWH